MGADTYQNSAKISVVCIMFQFSEGGELQRIWRAEPLKNPLLLFTPMSQASGIKCVKRREERAILSAREKHLN